MASVSQGCNAVSPSATGVELQRVLESVRTDLASLMTQFNQLRADYNAHVHAGVTVGAGSSSAVAATTAAAVALGTSA